MKNNLERGPQFPVVDPARDQAVPLLGVGGAYLVWTPHHAFDAAVLLQEPQKAGPVP